MCVNDITLLPMATLDDIKIAKQRWSRSLPEDLMEKSQSEPGCAVEEGRPERGRSLEPAAGAACRAALGRRGLPGHTPFDSSAVDSRSRRALLPA